MTRSWRTPLLVVGAANAVTLLVTAFIVTRLAAAGWLIAFAFLSAVPLGSLGWLMIHRLTGGRWGYGLQPTFTATTAAIPLLGLLSIPVLLALPRLYPWVAGAQGIKPDVAVFYLSLPLFLLRAAIAWVGWSVLALVLPRTGGRAGILLAAVGLVFYALMVSLLSVDWILSIEPTFISTSFGATVAITQLLTALAVAALFARGLDEGVRRDLGGLMLTATLGVTYLNFMTILVLWYGNLPTKVSWFVERLHGPWMVLAVATFLFGSVIPILLLLLARVRSSRTALRYVGASSLTGIAFYWAWLLAPAFGPLSLGTAVLATVTLVCAFTVIAGAGWPAVLFDRTRTAP